jgi:hypothetical protein
MSGTIHGVSVGSSGGSTGLSGGIEEVRGGVEVGGQEEVSCELHTT